MGDGVRFCTTCRAVYHADFARCPNDGGAIEVHPGDPLVGTQLARYQVDAFIGSGAMGRVYRCHHVHLAHKQFALKVLHGDLAATMAMRLRFTQEAEAASRLVHPNLVSVIDFGRTDAGLLYLAMEYVAGETLANVIARGRLSAARTVRLARELCLGLAHAHELGFVHRDFKPDNIIVVRDAEGEHPRILDFGLAIHADPDSDAARLTQAGAAVGTPVYAAPEQMSNADIDHRADLFGLGVTMYEMLAGKVPFDGNLLEILHLNGSGVRPAIATRVPGVTVPPRLEKLVLRLMSPVAADRPASTRTVLDELAALERELGRGSDLGLPVVASRNTPPPDSIYPPVVRRRRRAVVLVPVLGVVAGAAVLYVAMPSQDAESTAPAVAVAPTGDRTVPPAHPVTPPPVAPPPVALPPVVEAPPVRVAVVPPPAHGKKYGTRVATGSRTASAKAAKLRASPPANPPPPPEPIAPAPTAPTPTATDTTSAPAIAPAPIAPPAPTVAVVAPPKLPRVVTAAKLTLDGLSVRGSLTSAQVRRALERVTASLQGCYAPAVTAAGRSPAVTLRTSFEIDESQRARSIRTASTELPGLAACIDRALASVRSEAAPDVGTVDVSFALHFVPEGS